jgi:thiol:disulfide interchange protein DsbA
MGFEHKVHAAVFDAIQNQHKRLTDKNDMADFLATQGVDKDKFLATFDSFAIQGQVKQAKELAKKYEITGVPSMVVNGKYRFDLGTAGGPEGVLNVADQLIDKERAAK